VIAITVWVSWWAWPAGASAPAGQREWAVGGELRPDLDQPASDLPPYGAASDRRRVIRSEAKPELDLLLAFDVDLSGDLVRQQRGFPFDCWDRSG
jgi:hypothetical protein